MVDKINGRCVDKVSEQDSTEKDTKSSIQHSALSAPFMLSVVLDVTLCTEPLVNFSKNTADIFLTICSQLHPPPSQQIDASPYFIVVLLISTVLVSGA